MEKTGIKLLVEFGMCMIDDNDISDSEREKIRNILEQYISSLITYEECSSQLFKFVGKNDPLIRINEILSEGTEPIPTPENSENESDSDVPQMRKKTRTWTIEEDIRLLAGVYRYGPDNWKMVAKYLGSGRSRSQCSQRWCRCLNPCISKRTWSEEEDKKLLDLVQRFGTKAWTKVSNLFSNRSDVQCRYHYMQIKSKPIKNSGLDTINATPIIEPKSKKVFPNILLLPSMALLRNPPFWNNDLNPELESFLSLFKT